MKYLFSAGLVRMFLIIALLCGGCTTITANRKDWTVEKAVNTIVREETAQFRGHLGTPTYGSGSISSDDIRAAETKFDDFYLSDTSPFPGGVRLTYRLRTIRFSDIIRVRRSFFPQILAVILTGGIGGPWCYDEVVDLRSGETITVRPRSYNGERYFWMNFIPIWLYPARLIHDKFGEAIDFLRQNALSADEDPRGGGNRPKDKAAIDDIRIKFAATVKNFIIARSSPGYWPLKKKSTGKLLKVVIDQVPGESICKMDDGRYSGLVLLRQVDNGDRIQARFSVNLKTSVGRLPSSEAAG